MINTTYLEYRESYVYADVLADGGKKITKTVLGETGSPNVVTVEYYDKYGRKVKDGYVNTSEYLNQYTHDYLGNVLTAKTAQHINKAWPETVTETYTYDYAGRLLTSQNILNQTASSTYNWLGQKLTASDYAGSVTQYTYDAVGRLIQTSTPFEVVGGNTHYSVSKTYYDPAGNVTSSRQNDNRPGQTETWNRTDYAYDGANRLVKTTLYDIAGTAREYTQYYYDAAGNMLRQYTGLHAPLTITGLDQVTTNGDTDYAVVRNTYDIKGRLTGMTDALNMSESYVYDINNLLTSKTDRKSQTTSYTYNSFGKVLSEGTGGRTYTYYKTGAVKTMTDGVSGVTTTYTYDAAGRLATETTNSVVNTYAYDVAGNKTGVTINNGSTLANTTYTYDKLNRMLTSTNSSNTATYIYDTNGNRQSLTYSNGNVTNYTYNLANLVTSVTNREQSGGTVFSAYSYTYFLDGNQYQKINSTGTTRTTTYAYDYAGRLLSEQDSLTGLITYTYDDYGNRATMTNAGVTTTYTYDKNNRLTGSSKTGEVIEYTYDNNGNQTEVETNGVVTEELTYDKLNRQTSSNSTTYTYRADGLRYSKTVSGTTTTHVWSGNNIWADLTSGSSRVYIWGINLIYNVSDSTMTFYMYNAHGDAIHLTSSTGTKSKDYDYDAFGNERNIVTNDTNLFRYCGEYFDKETGNIYLRARFYDPSIGRFISQDSVLSVSNKLPNGVEVPDPMSLNLYTYVYNNPVRYIDFTGNITWESFATGLSSFLSGLGAGILESITYGVSRKLEPGFYKNNQKMYYIGKISGNIAMIILHSYVAYISAQFGIVLGPESCGAVTVVGAAVAIVAATQVTSAVLNASYNIAEMRKPEKGKEFRGGTQKQRDKWYGYEDKDFQNWWHKKGKEEWGTGDIQDKNMAKEAYEYWVEQGKPKVK